MKASFVIPSYGTYKIHVAPVAFEKDAPQQQMRIYRNRTRLLATESTYESNWRGQLDQNDLIEADGEFDVTLEVTAIPIGTAALPENPHGHDDPRNDDTGHAAPV